MESIKQVLIERDGMTPEEADDLIAQAQDDFNDRLADGEDCYDICDEWFNLEPDYLMELIG